MNPLSPASVSSACPAVAAMPLWLNTRAASFPSFPSLKFQKTRAISKIPTVNTPKPRAISTVPLCSALFRQKFSLSHVVPPLAVTMQLSWAGRTGASPVPVGASPTEFRKVNSRIGEELSHDLVRRGRRTGQPRRLSYPNFNCMVAPLGGPVLRTLSRLQPVSPLLFNFVQVCSGLFNLKNFSRKTLPSRSSRLNQNQKTFQSLRHSAYSAYSAVNLNPKSQIPTPQSSIRDPQSPIRNPCDA